MTLVDDGGPRHLRVACIQLNAGEDMAANLDMAGSLVEEAAQSGAQLVALPENVARMTLGRKRTLEGAFTEETHPAAVFFSALSRRLCIWLLGGSIAVRTAPDSDRLFNRSLLFGPDGEIACRYDKIHMFDVDLADGESYRESALFRSGAQAVMAKTPIGRIGLTICYDVRFPELYRVLAKAGADIILVPAAFTRQTGQAHWHTLLRARAIETGAFILAPAQTGVHPHGRATFGHSLIVNPWGEILADGNEKTGFVINDLDLSEVGKARAAIPSLRHDREFFL